jgi:hypothetical protein
MTRIYAKGLIANAGCHSLYEAKAPHRKKESTAAVDAFVIQARTLLRSTLIFGLIPAQTK